MKLKPYDGGGRGRVAGMMVDRLKNEGIFDSDGRTEGQDYFRLIVDSH